MRQQGPLESCSIERIRKEDVQLPTLGPLLAEVQAEVVSGRGFALLKGLPVHRWNIRCGMAAPGCVTHVMPHLLLACACELTPCTAALLM